MELKLTDKTFKTEVLQSNTPLIVDFWASWCGPCKMLAPIFEELSHEFKGKLKFAKLSTEDYPYLAQERGITGIPCLIVFDQGKEIDRIVGFNPKPILKMKIEAILHQINS